MGKRKARKVSFEKDINRDGAIVPSLLMLLREGRDSFMCRTSLLSISFIGLVIAFLFNSFFPLSANAHTNSYGYMNIYENPTEVKIDLTLDYEELANVVNLPINIESTSIEQLEASLTTKKDEVKGYISTGMRVYRDEMICEPQFISTKVRLIDKDPVANFQLQYPCEGKSTRIAYELFVDDINRSHINFATLIGNKETQEFTFTIAEREWAIGERNWFRQAWNFMVLGIEHIITGYDHILFVLCLIIPATITIGRMVEVITAFTLGHSITLGIATLGILTLPERIIEPAIALSIIFVAVSNLLKWETKNRWIITFLFGLIHGFGFAGILQEMELSRSTIASSLLFFNVGVEVGQIAIIALVFPLLVLFRKYKRFPAFVSASSVSIITIGLFWFVQRAAGL
ncbi:HupE/UreJ family protein [Bacillus sp. FJAT-49732]|uniref:HupE/UreJ family protein n=1 Tax=Lederbergia citrisecunda TaxID=2833583 RepID=A0A942YLQ4_9BACI|nr:HupE/UreJ family protein [Lederbergia citrisecunda]